MEIRSIAYLKFDTDLRSGDRYFHIPPATFISQAPLNAHRVGRKSEILTASIISSTLTPAHASARAFIVPDQIRGIRDSPQDARTGIRGVVSARCDDDGIRYRRRFRTLCGTSRDLSSRLERTTRSHRGTPYSPDTRSFIIRIEPVSPGPFSRHLPRQELPFPSGTDVPLLPRIYPRVFVRHYIDDTRRPLIKINDNKNAGPVVRDSA